MRTPAAPGVVFWDFDGTLAWRDQMWRGSLVTALDRTTAGSPVTAEMLRPGLRNAFPWHRHGEDHRHLDTADLWWSSLTEVFVGAYLRAGVDESTARAAASLVREIYPDPRYWSVFPDTRPALALLRDAGWRNVILSNHVPELPRLVRDLGIDDLVEEVLTSATTGYEKPHPEMFEGALASARPADAFWMIGDNPAADIAGAAAAGIPGILVRKATTDALPLGLHQAATIIMEQRQQRPEAATPASR
jgi:putative hydrolase of the HAD superfamily